MKILHIDIETAPNTAHVWGLWNQNVGLAQLMDSSYTLCWAAKWQGEKKVYFDSVHQSEEIDMLQGIWDLLNEADAVVHYNGKKFDIPTLNKEFLLNGMKPPAPYKQIDLLMTARKRFRFPSNKLDYVAQALGLGKKVKHIGHELWVKCMAGDNKAWKMMKDYNKQDVVLLEKVYDALLPWITAHPNHALYQKNERPVCPNCGGRHVHKRGFAYTLTQKYQRYSCTGCGAWLRGRNTVLDKDERQNVLAQVAV